MNDSASLATSFGDIAGSGVGNTSPGRRRHFPKTASAGDAPRAAWGVALSERRTQGSFFVQSPAMHEAVRAVLRVR